MTSSPLCKRIWYAMLLTTEKGKRAGPRDFTFRKKECCLMKKCSEAKTQLSQKLDDLAKRTINKAIQKEMEEWPPTCSGPLYQPKRPPLPGQPQR